MRFMAIAKVAALELLHERVFYILLAFAVVAIAFSNAVGQLTYVDQSKLSLDFMLAGSQLSMVLFSIFVGIGLFQREITSGSVAMVLSKPISRSVFLLGKFAGQSAVQGGVVLSMAVLTVLAYAFQENSQGTVLWGIFQSFFLGFLEMTVMSSVTYFIATFSGALTTGTLALCWFFLGHYRKTFEVTSDGGIVWSLVEKALPCLEAFNSRNMAGYGVILSTTEVLWVSFYAVILVVCYLLGATLVFSQRDIST